MTCAEHFADTGFLDLLPIAREIAQKGGYNEQEMEEAICMTFDKSRDYPPTRNRSKWFRIVFAEKLAEARSMMIRRTYEARRGYSTSKPQTD
jgi:hypothetical protein